MKPKTLLLLALLAMPLLLFGADVYLTNTPPVGTNFHGAVAYGDLDTKAKALFDKYSWVKLLIVPLATVFVTAWRKWVGKIPDQAWPWISPFLGLGIDFAAAKIGLWTGSAEAGLLLGTASTWFHQLGSQTMEAAQDGATVTKPDGTTKGDTKPPTP